MTTCIYGVCADYADQNADDNADDKDDQHPRNTISAKKATPSLEAI